jgi:hypothetical protein
LSSQSTHDILSDELTIDQWRTLPELAGGRRPLAVLIRNPFTHVPSQYYHCKTSPVHLQGVNAQDLMPNTLHAWVEIHADAIAEHPPNRTAKNGIMGNKFRCYKPHNLQAQRAGVDLSAFAFVGLSEEMKRSVCLLSYYVRGRLPLRCQCDADASGEGRGGGRGAEHTFETIHQSHGVAHHPGTTEADRALIIALVQQDILLYETAKLRFSQHVHEVEQATNHTICTTNK